jgi:LPXTG-motif cell wall-anchored protein
MKTTAHHALRALLLGTVAVFALGGAAHAADYPPSPEPVEGSLTAHVGDDGMITVAGDDCGANESVDITFDNESVATATADSDGSFEASFRVPDGATAGSHTVMASNDNCELTTTVTVNDDGEATLPRTGSSNTYSTVIMALFAVGVGTTLVTAARRRRLAVARRS